MHDSAHLRRWGYPPYPFCEEVVLIQASSGAMVRDCVRIPRSLQVAEPSEQTIGRVDQQKVAEEKQVELLQKASSCCVVKYSEHY